MSATANKHPYFDLSEIIPDNDLSYKIHQPLKPVKTGNFVPGFNLKTDYERWHRFYSGAATHGPVMLRALLNKPLVISFYSKHWQEAGLEQLIRLNAIQHEIRANGGNLLIIIAENDDTLAKTAWNNNLSVSFYIDNDKEIAEQFRIYSEDYPVWTRFSGIDVNVPLPATYVIDPSKQVIYDYVDMDFTGAFPSTQILSAVYGSALAGNNKKSA